jgi:hypothetical protein
MISEPLSQIAALYFMGANMPALAPVVFLCKHFAGFAKRADQQNANRTMMS